MPPNSKGTLFPFPPQVCDGQPDCGFAGELGPSPEEQGCGAWGPWNSWGPCSRTCGPGVQGRSRHCSPPDLPVLQHCLGPEHQTQACFTAACPGAGAGVPGRASGAGGGAERTRERKTTGLTARLHAPPPPTCPAPPPHSGWRMDLLVFLVPVH